MMKTIRFKSVLPVAVALLASALTGCQSNGKPEILKPIENNLVGSWELTLSSQLDDQGNTLETIQPEGSSFIYRFKGDGKMVNVRTMPDGNQELRSYTWTANDEQNTYTLAGKPATLITRLTADELEYRTDTMQLHDGKTVTPVPGIFFFRMKRVAEETSPAERVVGKWVFKQTYEKVDGEWREKNYKFPWESWREFKDNGRVVGHQKQGDKASDYEVNWRINIRTDELCMYEGERTLLTRMELADDNTMLLYYDKDYDAETGEVAVGEFKDVCIRVK